MSRESQSEIGNVIERYERRETRTDKNTPLEAIFEKDRIFRSWIEQFAIDSATASVYEIGCGTGSQLQRFLNLGFQPRNLYGCDLISKRIEEARRALPGDVHLEIGDALSAHPAKEKFTIVFQSTVFSSILSDSTQRDLANKMLSLVESNGGILWYDFIYLNPFNRDVRGVPMKRIQDLFPDSQIAVWPLTLLPPLGRLAHALHPVLYRTLNKIPFLKTHLLCWITRS